MAQYSSNLRGLYETPVLVTDSHNEAHPERVENILREARETGRTLLTEIEAKAILSSYGILVVETRRADDEEEAVELILGKRVDPNFGPIILFGAGGRLTDVWHDRAIGLPPLNATLASANEAELAIVISDDWQGKGLGTKLVGDLLTIGRTEGLKRVIGYILPENYVMQRIFRKLGFEVRYDTSRDVFRIEIELQRH
jgi:RimJ/RimL family protein N-acetyltransferase